MNVRTKLAYYANEQRKKLLVAVVESKLHFFDVFRIIFSINSMIFVKSFFGKTPKSFNAVDVVVAAAKRFRMLHPIVFAVLFQVLVGLEIIRVKHGTFPRLFLDVLEQRFSGNVRNGCRVNPSITLQNAEYGLFVERAATTVSFAFAAEVGLVRFDESTQLLEFKVRVPNDGFSVRGVTRRDRVV